ncbi:MAG TPA: antitoxin VapB family protein [Nitrososphaera sp.]|nr:antitoxin VapB family protein [Nitrososphaera sp.]
MISEKAYEMLKRRKRKDESFTDVILRLGSEKGSVAKLLDLVRAEDFEPIGPETAKEMKEASSEFRMNSKLRDAKLL